MAVAAGGRDVESIGDMPAEIAVEFCVVGGFGEHCVRLNDRSPGINPYVFSGPAGIAWRFWAKFGMQILESIPGIGVGSIPRRIGVICRSLDGSKLL
jgi:hypothetical protein